LCSRRAAPPSGASPPAPTAKRLVNPQHSPDPVPGQEEKWDKGVTFRNVTNPRPIEDQKHQRVSTYNGPVDQREGYGQPPLGLGGLLRRAGVMYAARAGTLVPASVLVFVLLRELLLVIVAVEGSPLALLLLAVLIQAVIPAFVGSLLVAAAVVVLAGEAQAIGPAWAALSDQRADIYRAAGWSAVLALFAAVTLGAFGIIVQPVVLGPPLLIHDIVLRRNRLDLAWARTKDMVSRDSRQLVYLLAIPAAIGIVLSSALRAFGVLSGDIPGVLRGVLHFAAQGALFGAAIPLVAAVSALLYGEMASTLGGEETA